MCDNEAVCKKDSNIDSSFNKKHSDIAYHFERWNVAAKVFTIAWIPPGENLEDKMEKYYQQWFETTCLGDGLIKGYQHQRIQVYYVTMNPYGLNFFIKGAIRWKAM